MSKRKSAFRIGGRLSPSRIVRLSEFFPGDDWEEMDVGIEVFRAGHPRVVEGFIAYSQDPAFEAYFKNRQNGEADEEPAEVDLDSLAETRAENVDQIANLCGDTVIGRLEDFPTEDGPIEVSIEDEDRHDLLVALLGELPAWFGIACMQRSQRQEAELQEKAAETAGKS